MQRQNCEVISQSFLDFICGFNTQHHHGYVIDTMKSIITVTCGLHGPTWCIDFKEDTPRCEKAMSMDDVKILKTYMDRWAHFRFVFLSRCGVACVAGRCAQTPRFLNYPVLACRSVYAQCKTHLEILDPEVQEVICDPIPRIGIRLHTQFAQEHHASYGERCTHAWLTSHELVEIDRGTVTSMFQPHKGAFSTEQTFPELRHDGPLRLDFWVLPYARPWQFPTGVGIEIDFDRSHLECLATDAAKNAFFHRRCIPLIRIPLREQYNIVPFLEEQFKLLQDQTFSVPEVFLKKSEMIPLNPGAFGGFCICLVCGRPSHHAVCTNSICQGKLKSVKSSAKQSTLKHIQLQAATMNKSVKSFCAMTQENKNLSFTGRIENSDVLSQLPVRGTRLTKEECDILTREWNAHFVLVNGDAAKPIVMELRDGNLILRSPSETAESYCFMEGRLGCNPVQIWRENEHCRRIDRVEFDPEHKDNQFKIFNLFRGFDYKMSNGETTLLEEHLLKEICKGDVALFSYIVKWQAWILQHPGTPTKVCLCLKGKPGKAKESVFWHLQQILGKNHCYETNNIHDTLDTCSWPALSQNLLTVLDETMHFNVSLMQKVLTSTVREFKLSRKNRISLRNCSNYLLLLHRDACVELDERRYFCIQVPSNIGGRREREQQHYFKKVYNVDPPAWARFLRKQDLSEFDPTVMPITEEKQKMSVAETHVVFLEKVLRDGFLQRGSFGTLSIQEAWKLQKDELYKLYTDFCHDKPVLGPKNFFDELQNIFPSLHSKRAQNSYARAQFACFPDLKTCRDEFQQFMDQLTWDWEENEDTET